MKLTSVITLREIALLLNREFIGSADHIISGINEIHQVEAGDIAFVDHPKYYDKCLNSEASTIIIDTEVDCPEGKGLIISPTPFADYNKLTKHFSPFKPLTSNLGEGSSVSPSTTISPNVIIGNNVKIGENCIIHSGVIIYENVTIKNNVIIHANSVLGSDAFYYNKKEDVYNKMHTCGNVLIEDDVEIGALCTIDRGVSGTTRIGKGSKIDNKVHIGHDTVIGDNCLIAALVGIAGCVTIEDNVTLWGQVGIPSDVTVGKGAVLLGQSGISKSVEGGKTYFGSPATEAREKFKELAFLKKLPQLFENSKKDK